MGRTKAGAKMFAHQRLNLEDAKWLRVGVAGSAWDPLGRLVSLVGGARSARGGMLAEEATL